MLRALYSSAAGMQSQQLNLDVIANNLANVNTSGFKKSKIEFQDLLYQTSRAPGAEQGAGNQLPTGLQIGHGSRPVATSKIFTNGDQSFRVQLVRFANPAGLESLGRNLYRESPASGAAELGNPGENGFGDLAQGYLEMSNVKVVEEMVNMIVAQRAYEINAKAVQAADEMMQMSNNLRRT